jgi:hypothetical protein
MKTQFKYLTFIGLCAGSIFAQAAHANSCQTNQDVEITPPDITNVVCGSEPIIFPYEVTNCLPSGHAIPIEEWNILIDDQVDSWPENDDLVTIVSPVSSDPNYSKLCKLGDKGFTGTCIVNVAINTVSLGYCPTGGLTGIIDRTLRLDIESPQIYAYAPIETELSPNGDLDNWTYLGPSVINDPDAGNAQANKNVGQTVEGGVISGVTLTEPTAAFYSWNQQETINAVNTLAAVYASYYGYLFTSSELPRRLGTKGDRKAVNAGTYSFDRDTWPVTIDGVFTINGGPTDKAVFVLDFDYTTSESIILSVFKNAKIKLTGGILPENVIWVLNNGSLETAGSCQLSGMFLVNGGFEDEADDRNGGCSLIGNAFIYVNDNNPPSPGDPYEGSNIALDGTSATTP